MNTSMIITTLGKKNNGSWFNIQWVSDLPVNAASKKSGVVAYKITTAQCRKGIRYSSQKSVQAKVENGKVLDHELPWGKWVEGHEGLLIEHKENIYVRLYLGPNTPHTSYFLNGKEVTIDELKESGCILNSFFKPTSSAEKPDALTVKAQNIQQIW